MKLNKKQKQKVNGSNPTMLPVKWQQCFKL